jgi:GT2 family glycosyltransferase
MKAILHKLAPEWAKECYRISRAWVLSRGLKPAGPFALSDEERWSTGLMSVVIAVHDGPEVTERCFKSLERFGGDAEIIVVDDASKLEVTRQIVDDYSKRNGWKVIRHEKALGHSRASEAGAAIATRRFLCLLNSDTVVTHRSWAAIVNAFDLSPDIAIVGPSTSHTAGVQKVRRAELCRRYWNDGQIASFAEQYVTEHEKDDLVDLPFLGGFAFFVRKTLWDDIGGFDKNLPDYGNESDFCRRVKESGLRIVWSKGAYIHHLGGESYGRTLGFKAINERSLKAESYIQNKWDKKVPAQNP